VKRIETINLNIDMSTLHSSLKNLTLQSGQKELKIVAFHRDQVLLVPTKADLLTLEDADEHKLPALNDLLVCMGEFYSEMASVGISPYFKDTRFSEGVFLMTDTEYKHFEPFKIRIVSKWFLENPLALHAGFEFFLRVVQDGHQGRGEFADWINIRIKHFDVVPISFASRREHVRVLSRHCSYFEDISMEDRSKVRNGMDDVVSFKTKLFNQSVQDACLVMRKIISRKTFLEVLPQD
jgi:hypothetical protein